MNNQESDGFTLSELLIIIGIISILTLGIVVYISPNLQFAQARDSVRDSHVNILTNALNAYKFDNLGSLEGLNLSEIPTDICNPNYTNPENCIDLTPLKEEGYISKLPTDPRKDSNSENIGYKVELIGQGQVIIHADYEERETLNWPNKEGYIYDEGTYSLRFVEGNLISEGDTSVVQFKEDNYLLTAIYTDIGYMVEGTWVTDLPIDLSDYNEINIEYEIEEAPNLGVKEKKSKNLFASRNLIAASTPVDSINFNLTISSLMNGSYNEAVDDQIELTKDTGRLIETLDVSGINEEKYIRIHAYDSMIDAETAKNRNIKVYNLWLE